jgi:F0F1-type ATP synthase assembly protein I
LFKTQTRRAIQAEKRSSAGMEFLQVFVFILQCGISPAKWSICRYDALGFTTPKPEGVPRSMEYAIQLLLPVVGGLMLGMWLTKTYGIPQIWTVVLAILGMAAGLFMMYRRVSTPGNAETQAVRPKKSAGTQPFPSSQSSKATATPSPKPEHPGVHVRDLDFLYHPPKTDDSEWKELDDPDEEDFPHG